jgi:ribosomal-protein-alanine N-acetyltransferase
MSAVLRELVDFSPLAPGDLDEIMPIEQAIYPFPWTRGNFVDSLRAGYSGWVYRIDGAVVGYGVCMRVLDEIHLLNLSIASSRQGRGYGARLLRFLMDLYAASGSRQMLLEVRPSNAPALKLYRQFGFNRIGVRRNYYPAADGREDAWVMVRGLESC